MHATREVGALARCMQRACAGDRIERARQWLLGYADSSAGQSRVVLALVDLASGESLALTSGRPDGVWIAGAPARWLLHPERRVWSIHNHPEGHSASPVAVLPSIADVSVLARSAIETVEVCTARGLLTATTVGPTWSRGDAHATLRGGAQWTQALESARRMRDGLAATVRASWAQAQRTAHAATLETLNRAGLIRMSCSQGLEPLWAAHRDGALLSTMRRSAQEAILTNSASARFTATMQASPRCPKTAPTRRVRAAKI